MSLLRRLPLGRLRSLKPRADGPKGGFLGEGHVEPGGLLFNETPPAAGQARKWESWEGPWYFTFGAAVAILSIGLPARPDTSLVRWADRQAAERAAEA